jgi:hypothetical protein
VPVKIVTAIRGKVVRTEPISTLYARRQPADSVVQRQGEVVLDDTSSVATGHVE